MKKQTKEECKIQMAAHLAYDKIVGDKREYRVRYCRQAKEYVVQILEPDNDWLCLHNDTFEDDKPTAAQISHAATTAMKIAAEEKKEADKDNDM